MWKKIRTSKEDIEPSRPQQRAAAPEDAREAKGRPRLRYDGDLTQGDEGIDDPPEQ